MIINRKLECQERDILAKVIEGYSQLRKDYNKHMNKVKIAILLAIVSFFLTGWQSFFFFVMLGCILYCLYEYVQAKEYKTGIDGERQMVGVSVKLPPKYTVITNVELFHEGRATLYDAIVVGPAGIFILEVKNMNGRVVGYAYDSELTQHKVGRKGGHYSKDVKNPIKALGYQTHLLSSIMKHHNIGAWIGGIVFFSNRNVTVKIAGSNVPIFTMREKGAKKLKQYLIEQESKNQPLNEQVQKKAIAILTGKVS